MIFIFSGNGVDHLNLHKIVCVWGNAFKPNERTSSQHMIVKNGINITTHQINQDIL